MTRAIPFLAGLVAAIIVFAGTGAQAAATAQAVGFVLHDNAAATERLPFYRSAVPIAINVHAGASSVNAMTVTAHGPGGSAISAPLVRTGDAFTGALHLTLPGTWTLALTSQLGSTSAALADVPLDVVDDNADLAARVAWALSALSIGAGFTVLARARRSPAPSAA